MLKRLFISAVIAPFAGLVVACQDDSSQLAPQSPNVTGPNPQVSVSQSLPKTSTALTPPVAKPEGFEAVGPVSRFKADSDPTGIAIKGKNVVVFNKAGELYVFSDICTHQGCQVEFAAKPQKFICPCHGSEFDRSGELIKGPAPTRLPKFSFTILNDNLFVNFN